VPELKNRTKEEQEIAAILLLMFASEDMDFWLSGFHSPQYFQGRLAETTLSERFRSISRRAQDQMLRDLRREVLRAPVDDRMRRMAEFQEAEIAIRLARRHAEWLQKLEEEQRQRDRDIREGKEVDEPDEPRIEDIYPKSWADREAASTVTDWVSQTEIFTGDVIEDTHGIKLEAFWMTEPGACPICEPLDRTPRAEWSKKFPRGPKAHPNCLHPDTFVRFPFGQAASMKSLYDGPMCYLRFSNGHTLNATPGHPVPTARGMVDAGKIRVGDLVFAVRDHGPPQSMIRGMAERLHANAKAYYGASYQEPERSMLHGDAKRVIDPIEIVELPGFGYPKVIAPEDAIIAALKKPSLGYEPVEVTQNSERHYDGPVYDFSAIDLPMYVANEILVSNCRCWLDWREVLNP
jgi:hypothetical protein